MNKTEVGGGRKEGPMKDKRGLSLQTREKDGR